MRLIGGIGLLVALGALGAAIGWTPLHAQPVWPDDDDPFYKPMTFMVARHGLTGSCFIEGRAVPAIDIYVVGEFDVPAPGQPGPAERFQAFLRANPTVRHCTTVFFHSPGGEVQASLNMGEIIRAHGLNTSIGLRYTGAADLVRRAKERAICFSACSFAFLGGVRRSAGTGHYGVHRFARGKPKDERKDKSLPRTWRTDAYFQERTQKLVATLLAYFAAMDVSPDLLQETAKAKSVENVGDDEEPAANFLSAATMARLRVTTPAAAGEWAIVNDRGAAAIRATIRLDGAEHALMLTCERPGNAAPRLMIGVFLQTTVPDLYLAARKLTIWRRERNGPVQQGFRIFQRSDFALADIARAETSPRRQLAGGRPGVVAAIPVETLGFDLRRQTEVTFSLVARVERTVMGPSGPRKVLVDDQFGFQVDMTGGTQKIAEFMDTCR